MKTWKIRALAAGLLLAVVGVFQNCGAPSATKLNMAGSAGSSSNSNNGLKPAAPSQLAATSPSSQQVDLSWKDNSNNESGFKIERSSSVSGPFTTSTGAFGLIQTTIDNVTTFSDLNLLPSTQYYYRISATNSTGDSVATSSVSVTTGAAPSSPPSPPSNLAAAPQAATIMLLSWNDNSNNESYFKVERSANNGTTFSQIASTSANTHSFEDINLNPSATYTYRVRATNSLGDSAYSANGSGTTLAAGNTNTYTYIAANIIGPNCVACHGAQSAAAGIRYDTYNVTLATLSKGSAAGSRMFQSISAGRMPPGAPFTASQISILKTWIDSGALNN